jgi:hypothetical protein
MGCVAFLIAALATVNAAASAYANDMAKPNSSLVQLVLQRPPTDLNRYSLQFWPRNSLRNGQVVSTNTPYGRLTCRSAGSDRPRSCSLARR